MNIPFNYHSEPIISLSTNKKQQFHRKKSQETHSDNILNNKLNTQRYKTESKHNKTFLPTTIHNTTTTQTQTQPRQWEPTQQLTPTKPPTIGKSKHSRHSELNYSASNASCRHNGPASYQRNALEASGSVEVLVHPQTRPVSLYRILSGRLSRE